MPTSELTKNSFFGRRKGPLLVVVMDGVGLGPDYPGNAVQLAYKPTLDGLMQKSLWTKVAAHGHGVGNRQQLEETREELLGDPLTFGCELQTHLPRGGGACRLRSAVDSERPRIGSGGCGHCSTILRTTSSSPGATRSRSPPCRPPAAWPPRRATASTCASGHASARASRSSS